VLQRQFSSARPDEAPRPLDHVTIPTPQVPTATDRNYPNISTTAQGPPSDNQAFKDDTSFGGQPHPHPLVPGSQAVGQSPVLSRLMSTYGTPSVSPSTDYQPGLAHPAEQARNSTPSNLRYVTSSQSIPRQVLNTAQGLARVALRQCRAGRFALMAALREPCATNMVI